MTPEHIRMVALVCAAICVLYWLLLWALSPNGDVPLGNAQNHATHGYYSPIILGEINGNVHFGSKEQDTPPADLNINVINPDILSTFGADYVEGHGVGGLVWKNGYYHVLIRISNPSNVTYSDINIVIGPELPIADANCSAEFGDPKITVMASAPGPMPMIVLNEEGKSVAYSREQRLEKAGLPAGHFTLGFPYQLYSKSLPCGAEIVINLAVVQPVFFDDRMWLPEGRMPKYVDFSISFKAYGKEVTRDAHVEL